MQMCIRKKKCSVQMQVYEIPLILKPVALWPFCGTWHKTSFLDSCSLPKLRILSVNSDLILGCSKSLILKDGVGYIWEGQGGNSGKDFWPLLIINVLHSPYLHSSDVHCPSNPLNPW
ncbi:hypothetical protein E2320_010215 [Naja naja]|nr:hypothetical protein E2320_010215 [Naja naja]